MLYNGCLYSFARIHYTVFLVSIGDGQLSCFQFGAMSKITAANIAVCLLIRMGTHFCWVHAWGQNCTVLQWSDSGRWSQGLAYTFVKTHWTENLCILLHVNNSFKNKLIVQSTASTQEILITISSATPGPFSQCPTLCSCEEKGTKRNKIWRRKAEVQESQSGSLYLVRLRRNDSPSQEHRDSTCPSQ